MIPLRLIRKTTWRHPYGIEWLVSPEGLEDPNAQIILYDLGNLNDHFSTVTDEDGNVYTFNPATTERYDDGTFAVVTYRDPLPCQNPNPTKQNSPSSTPS